jgi:hypothetical protein
MIAGRGDDREDPKDHLGKQIIMRASSSGIRCSAAVGIPRQINPVGFAPLGVVGLECDHVARGVVEERVDPQRPGRRVVWPTRSTGISIGRRH